MAERADKLVFHMCVVWLGEGILQEVNADEQRSCHDVSKASGVVYDVFDELC